MTGDLSCLVVGVVAYLIVLLVVWALLYAYGRGVRKPPHP